jgi:glutathione S-transferase
MLVLYGVDGSQPVRSVKWLLEMKGLDYKYVETMPGSRKGTRSPDFLARNPTGHVPFLEDPDAGVALSEGAAILAYIASKHGFHDLYPATATARVAIDEYLHWHHRNTRSVTIGFFAPLVRLDLKLPADLVKSNQVTAVEALKFLENRLGQTVSPCRSGECLLLCVALRLLLALPWSASHGCWAWAHPFKLVCVAELHRRIGSYHRGHLCVPGDRAVSGAVLQPHRLRALPEPPRLDGTDAEGVLSSGGGQTGSAVDGCETGALGCCDCPPLARHRVTRTSLPRSSLALCFCQCLSLPLSVPILCPSLSLTPSLPLSALSLLLSGSLFISLLFISLSLPLFTLSLSLSLSFTSLSVSVCICVCLSVSLVSLSPSPSLAAADHH